MSKQEFLGKLKYELRKLKKEECKKYIDYYDEIISDIMDEGVPEEEAIKRQGDVKAIVQDILSNVPAGSLKIADWKGVLLLILSVISLLACIIPKIMEATMNFQMNSSISVIGGADGPTSIFIAGKISEPWGLYIFTVIVVIINVVYWVKRARRK